MRVGREIDSGHGSYTSPARRTPERRTAEDHRQGEDDSPETNLSNSFHILRDPPWRTRATTDIPTRDTNVRGGHHATDRLSDNRPAKRLRIAFLGPRGATPRHARRRAAARATQPAPPRNHATTASAAAAIEPAYEYLVKPMSLAYSRKQRRHMSRPYLRIRPRRLLHTRLRGAEASGARGQRGASKQRGAGREKKRGRSEGGAARTSGGRRRSGPSGACCACPAS